MVERILYLNLLYDFYGQTLTERQRQIFEMYYFEDLSLGEIAEQLAISRQAVYDLVHRSERTLSDLETKLKLVERYQRDQAVLEKVRSELRAVADQIEQPQLAMKLKTVLRWLDELER